LGSELGSELTAQARSRAKSQCSVTPMVLATQTPRMGPATPMAMVTA
jgi:hypothetical protein